MWLSPPPPPPLLQMNILQGLCRFGQFLDKVEKRNKLLGSSAGDIYRLVVSIATIAINTDKSFYTNLMQWTKIRCWQLQIIQILTGTVTKYHVSVDCQKSYIFPRENITLLAPTKRDISSVPVDTCYVRWSNQWLLKSKFIIMVLSDKLGNKTRVCVQNKLNANWTNLCAFYDDVLLLTTAYSAYEVHFFWVSFLIWKLCYCCCRLYSILNCYIFPVGQYNSVFDWLSMRA